ncbi:M16 family metallopeptidase [Chitinolyticbacter meiyuanensis]|uniref:M16 family metallopeptidase n=1 Tax=Chitinolyticbacter meiyuanensis TaxID=682798 RepID=UPI0011E5EB1D|nr:pitrilysin family protein [Chitinolyticbacter meiyuanensis]
MAAKWLAVALAFVASATVLALPTPQRWQTANGVPVALVERHDLPVIDVQIDFDAGESRSPADQPGLATLAFASIIDKQLEDYEWRTPYQLLTDSGNQYGVDVYRDRATLRLRMVSNRNNPGTHISTLAQQLANAKYPFETLKYRRDWLGGRFSSDPKAASAERALAYTLFGEHPLGRSDRRTPDSMRSVGNSDCRGFYRQYLVPGNANITFVGDIGRAEAERLADLLTEHLPKGEAAPPLPELKIASKVDSKPIRIVRNKNQSSIEMGQLLPLDRNADDYAALLLANYMFGGAGFESRLMRELREKRGLTYDVSSSLTTLRGVSWLSIEVATRSEEEASMLALLRGEVERFTRDGPEADEMVEAKDRFLRGMKFWGDDNADLLQLIANIDYYHLPADYYDRLAARITKLTAADVKAAWQRHVDPARFVVAIEGPQPKAAEDKPAPTAKQAAEPASDKADAS